MKYYLIVFLLCISCLGTLASIYVVTDKDHIIRFSTSSVGSGLMRSVLKGKVAEILK
ncbi:MAG: hypothetical protein ABI367_11350 [Mucilaginibacter sp.]